MKKWRQRSQSSAAIMLRSLVTMVLVLTLALSLVIILAVGHQLLTEVSLTTRNITNSLTKANIDGTDDWQNWRRNSTLNTSASYVYVHNRREDAKTEYYFSPNARYLLKVKPVKVPLIHNVYFRPGFGFLYHRMVHTRGITYTLWQNMYSQLAVLFRVIQVTGLLLILTLLVTPLYIRRLTKRLTGPVSGLSQTTKVITAAKEPGSMKLPVPKQPTEVTELATNFNELLAMLDERQEQQKLFVMNAAHELRTPIATIRSHAQLIERHGKEHPEIIGKSVRYITEESRQMQQLIEELLALSRADRLVLDVAELDLSAVVTNTVQKITGTFPQTFKTDITPNVQLTGNENAIEQILNSILTNASKYSPADSTIEINLLQTSKGTSQISVKDQGRGISDDDKPHIFERFYRSADVRGSVAGTGLGLAIASQLTTLIGGELTVSDNHPSGSVFTLAINSNASQIKR
ncbi:sensor histidine kinase [Secundilactobacillus hailunensis]|uniref:histidine kinase n=1 Tax=Secundilactobacillus hailunensis TaxID=2559923 RepID=A0ABW1T9T9_9LACO|nr:HAMP domain-containing sensor histidine kinase [Secundilactobacillus hailunensis]